jgi:ABC-2 type transport system permease protein
VSTWWRCLSGVVLRENLRFFHQRGRFFGALVRPLVWLLVFAAGFRAALGLSIIPPYETYISYEVYILPGLVAMVQLFNGMQNSLSIVYDTEMGSMRVLLTSPLPRWWLLTCKLLAGVSVSLLQVYAFLGLLNGLLLGSLGLLLSSQIRQLENFAGVMNFVVFPMFFISSALYPLWKMRESSELLYYLCAFNPFTHGVEMIRFALYGRFNPEASGWVLIATAIFLGFALWGYKPGRGLAPKRGG